MSAYAARLKSDMRPLLDELKELRDLEAPTDEQKSDIDRIVATLGEKKSEHDKAVERENKARTADAMFETLSEPAPMPRAVYEKNGGAAPDERKGWFDTLIETKSFKRGASDGYQVRESMPVAKLYPFLETKAPFIPGNVDRSAGLVDIYTPFSPRPRHAVLDLVRTVPSNEFNINYLPLTFTNNATEAPWGTPKAESTNTGSIQTITQTTIAHWKETPRQVLRYIPQLRGEIDTEMREGVLSTLEYRVIRGTGVAPQMNGILNQSTNVADGDDLISQIFFAVGEIENAGGTVDAILMNPRDYSTLIQQEWANNQFNPLIQNERFGTYRIVKSGAIPEGQAIVADWNMAVTLYIGDALRVAVTEALGLKNNIVTFLGEMDAVVLLARPWLLYECPGPLIAAPG
jgi:hypothetical protein